MNHLVGECDPREQEWELKDEDGWGYGGAHAIYLVIAYGYQFLDPKDLLRNVMKYVFCALPV